MAVPDIAYLRQRLANEYAQLEELGRQKGQAIEVLQQLQLSYRYKQDELYTTIGILTRAERDLGKEST